MRDSTEARDSLRRGVIRDRRKSMDDVLLGIVLRRMEESPLAERAADLLLAALEDDETAVLARPQL